MVQNRVAIPEERIGFARSFINPGYIPVEDVYRDDLTLLQHVLRKFDYTNEDFGECFIYMTQDTEVTIRTALDFGQEEIKENFLNPEEKAIFTSSEVWQVGYTLYCDAVHAREDGKKFFVALTIKKADRLRSTLEHAKISAVVTSYEEITQKHREYLADQN